MNLNLTITNFKSECRNLEIGGVGGGGGGVFKSVGVQDWALNLYPNPFAGTEQS